jgi:hypothetical protein
MLKMSKMLKIAKNVINDSKCCEMLKYSINTSKCKKQQQMP